MSVGPSRRASATARQLLSATMLAVVASMVVIHLPGLALTAVAGVARPAATGAATSWKVVATTTRATSLTGVSCPSAQDCWAIGSDLTASGGAPSAVLLGTRNGGASWTTESVTNRNPSNYGLSSLDCPSVSVCYAVGAANPQPGSGGTPTGLLFMSVNGGATWSSSSLPGSVGSLGAIGCLDPTHCVAVGTASNPSGAASPVLIVTSDGSDWSQASIPLQAGDELLGVTCIATTSLCFVTGTSGALSAAILLSSADGGTTWNPEDLPSGVRALGLPACPSTSTCFIPGLGGGTVPTSLVVATTNGGTTWATESLPSGVAGVSTVGCASAAECFTLGITGSPAKSVILATYDGGASWSVISLPGSVADLAGIACPSACIAVGQATTGTGIVVTSPPPGARPLNIATSASLQSAVVGEPYHEQLNATGGAAPYSWSTGTHPMPPGLVLSRSGQISGDPSTAGQFTIPVTLTDSSASPQSVTGTLRLAVEPAGKAPVPSALWVVLSNGVVRALGGAPGFRSRALRGTRAAGVASSPDGRGYEVVFANGSFVARGDAPHCRRPKSAPGSVVAVALERAGCLLLTSVGRVVASGGARSYGDLHTVRGAGPAVAIVATPGGSGYWLATRSGRVVAFGDAHFYGSATGRHLRTPVVALAATTDGRGYWLTTRGGQVFAFGDARSYGSTGGTRFVKPVVALAGTADNGGYWLIESDGQIKAFGDAGRIAGARVGRLVDVVGATAARPSTAGGKP